VNEKNIVYDSNRYIWKTVKNLPIMIKYVPFAVISHDQYLDLMFRNLHRNY